MPRGRLARVGVVLPHGPPDFVLRASRCSEQRACRACPEPGVAQHASSSGQAGTHTASAYGLNLAKNIGDIGNLGPIGSQCFARGYAKNTPAAPAQRLFNTSVVYLSCCSSKVAPALYIDAMVRSRHHSLMGFRHSASHTFTQLPYDEITE